MTLAEAIGKRDTNMLAAMCEGNLRNAFVDFYESMAEEDCKIWAEN